MLQHVTRAFFVVFNSWSYQIYTRTGKLARTTGFPAAPHQSQARQIIALEVGMIAVHQAACF